MYKNTNFFPPHINLPHRGEHTEAFSFPEGHFPSVGERCAAEMFLLRKISSPGERTVANLFPKWHFFFLGEHIEKILFLIGNIYREDTFGGNSSLTTASSILSTLFICLLEAL